AIDETIDPVACGSALAGVGVLDVPPARAPAVVGRAPLIVGGDDGVFLGGFGTDANRIVLPVALELMEPLQRRVGEVRRVLPLVLLRVHGEGVAELAEVGEAGGGPRRLARFVQRGKE